MGATHRLAVLAAAATAAATCALLPASAAVAAPEAPWNLRQARVPAAQALGRGGAGVTVAVLDTWVDTAHPALHGTALAGADCVDGCRTQPAPTPDRCDHGTHVAGLIGSTAYGVAPSVTLLPVRVLRYDQRSHACTGSAQDVAAGIGWAVAHHARVLNLSVGTLRAGDRRADPVRGAIRRAAAAGVVVVVAAGNSATRLGVGDGGAAIVVGATGPDGSLASYSERGPAVDVAAPGGDSRGPACRPSTCVVSTAPGGRYALHEGTSMAAAEVSGIAALVLGARPSLRRVAVARAIESTARPLAGVRYGRVDALAAVRAAVPARASGADAETASRTSPATAPVATTATPRRRVGGAALLAVGAVAAAGAAAGRAARHRE